jgi:hypothetical protein
MKSQSSLPIQYGIGSKSEISRSFEKIPYSSGATESYQDISRTSSPTRSNESIIDVFERSKDNAAVPDERTVADRRQSSMRRHSSQASTSAQSDKIASEIGMSSTDQETNQTHSKTGNISPAIFSPSRDKGKLVDIWA